MLAKKKGLEYKFPDRRRWVMKKNVGYDCDNDVANDDNDDDDGDDKEKSRNLLKYLTICFLIYSKKPTTVLVY